MVESITYNDDQRLDYARYGNPRDYPVLIQHGAIASIRDGELFEELLRQRRCVISVARPGYGESSPYQMRDIAEWADIVAVLLDKLGVEHFDVLGISSGAPYSYALGHRFPERARRIYILSGTPALYDDEILAHWPYEVQREASLTELQRVAHDVFFSQLPEADLMQPSIQDSMRNQGFGLAQDLRLRCRDWGFRLSAVRVPVIMQHSEVDEAVPVVTAALTAKMLPNCTLTLTQDGGHFSPEILDDFIKSVMVNSRPHCEKGG